MKPRMIILFGLMTFLVMASACKPEARNNLAQPTVAVPARPALPEPATTVTVTSALSKPPVCQFESVVTATTLPTAESYIFSEPRVVYTTTGGGVLSIYGWLPDSNQLIINGYDEGIKRHTVEILNVQTREPLCVTMTDTAHPDQLA